MSVVVTCPKCAAKLRGPTELAGKAVRCQRCREKFRVPGGDPAAGSTSDTQQLSVVESKLAVPAVAIPPRSPAGTADDPLPLDDLILEESPKPAEAFSFEEPAPAELKKKKTRADDEDEDDRPARKRRDDDEQPRDKKGYQRKKSGAPWGILIGVGVLLLALGGGVAAKFLMGDKKRDETAKVDPPTPADSKAPPPKGKAKGESKTPNPTPGGGETNPVPPDPTPPKKDPQKKEPPKKEPPKKEPPKPKPPVEVKWPDPPAGDLTVIAKPKSKFAADFPPDKVKRIGTGNGRVIVAFNSKPGFQGVGVTDVIRQYTENGTKGREFEVDSSTLSWPRAFAVSDTDQMVAVTVNGGPANVSVYDFDAGNLLFDKKNVFEGADGRVGSVAALALGANRKLFVVDQAGTVDVWDMGVRERMVTGTPAKRTAPGKPAAKACAFHDGAAVAVAVDGRVWAVDANGATAGKGVALPDPTATVLAMGAGAGTDRVAVAYALPGGRAGVSAVHPIEGRVEWNLVLPDGTGAPTDVAWAADTLLAVTVAGGSAAVLIDLDAKQATAYLKATAGKATLFPAVNALWWQTEDAGKPALVSVGVPFDEYFNLKKTIGEDRRPLYLVPRPDGLAK